MEITAFPAPEELLVTAPMDRSSSADLDGEPLDTEVAAVELINVLQPTVAVARYVTFA